MAELAAGGGDEALKSGGKSKFLSKSKWGKVFREREAHEVQHPSHTNSFKLNDDVNDFLKPSTDRAATLRPKIDVAIAQRWPNAHEVRSATAGDSPINPAGAGSMKPKRRKGLTVRFATTPPDVMGEGGDESQDPVTEISRSRAKMARSISDRKPGAFADGTPWQGLPVDRDLSGSLQRQPQQVPPGGDDDDFRPGSLRRAQTSHNEFSPQVQRQLLAPVVDDRPPTLPLISKTPTGLGLDNDTPNSTIDDFQGSYAQPSIDERFVVNQSQQTAPTPAKLATPGGLSPMPSDLGERRRSMRMSEGLAFRRASAMIMSDEKLAEARRDFSTGLQPSPQHYDILSRDDVAFASPDLSETPVSASSPSPFADPKYIRSHLPQNAPPTLRQDPSPQAERQRQRPPPDQPSYMRAQLPQQQQQQQQPAQQVHRPSGPQVPPQRSPQGAQRPLPSLNEPPAPQQRAPMSQNQTSSTNTQQTLRTTTSVSQPASFQQQAEHPSIPNARSAGSNELTTRPPRKDSRPGYGQPVSSSSYVQRQRAAPTLDMQPQLPEIEFDELQITEVQSNNTCAAPNPSSVPSSNRQSPQMSKRTSLLSDGSRSTSRSPLEERSPNDGLGFQGHRPYYTRPDGSTASLNRFPPASPQMDNSPASTRGSPLLPSNQFVGSAPQPPSGNMSYQTQPSPNRSTGSSAIQSFSRPRGQTSAESNNSNYLTRNAAARLSASNILQEQTERPGSSGSGVPYKNFSVPRPANAISQSSPATDVQQNVGVRPSLSGSAQLNQRSTADYSSDPRAPAVQPSRSSAGRAQDDGRRPGVMSPNSRGATSPMPPVEGNPAADNAYADFAARVAHMKGVFRLTAEKQMPADRCSPHSWLRAALWWFHRGKSGVDSLLSQRRQGGNPQQELLMQPHVDLAKAWWIVSDPLDAYNIPSSSAPPSMPPNVDPDLVLSQSVGLLLRHLKSLCLVMGRSQILPPHQSLIQGQDTTIWHEYPRFTPDVVAVLGGGASRNSLIMDQLKPPATALEALPLADTNNMFCYGRFLVEIALSTEEADTDRVSFPCMLSMLRARGDYQTTILLSSQNSLVNIKVGPRQGNERGVTWQDVTWRASSTSVTIRLPRGFDATLRMQERDFRSLWNLSEHSRNVERSLRAEADEDLVFDTRLPEMQYMDSSGSGGFPQEKLRGCMALVFQRSVDVADSGRTKKLRRGYRLLIVTDPGHKSLNFASHDICRKTPLLFEFMSDSSANGMVAMVIRVREEQRQCRMLLVFPDIHSRQALYDVLNGADVGPDEEIVGSMVFTAMNIENTQSSDRFAGSGHPALAALEWQKLSVTNTMREENNARPSDLVFSEHLRIVARHAAGCVTDRLNLRKGELLLRLPAVDSPTIQMLREPQEDLSISIDTRRAHPNVADGLTDLLQTLQNHSTIRTLTFATPAHLHAFQTAITGFQVRYDGFASTFSIQRRRMVVPIHKKLSATKVRLQIVARGSSLSFVLAFMEDFPHADAMCFQVKPTDVFELVKGNGKDKKPSVKLVEAKFSLPPPLDDISPPSSSQNPGTGATGTANAGGGLITDRSVRRRFVNLEGLENAEEHDDITVGFETDEDRDRFAQALPAETTLARGITLKRRI